MTKILPRSYDLKSLKLSAEEGFVLSRVDAPTTLEELAALCGMEHAKLVAIVETLHSQGAVEIEGRPPPLEPAPPSVPPASKPPPARSIPPTRSMPPLVAPRAMPQRHPSVGPTKAAAPATPPPKVPSRPPSTPPEDITRPKMQPIPAPVFGPIDELEEVAEADASDAELDEPTFARGKPKIEIGDDDDDADLDRPTVSRLALAIGGVCDVGKARTNNEDAMAVIDFTGIGLVDVTGKRRTVDVGDRGILLAVSDGMGGENAGEVASAMVLETLQAKLSEGELGDDPAATFAAAVQESNERVIAAAEKRELSGMGATLVAVLVTGKSAITAEVGDSRAYVLRHGKLTQLSKDQTHVRMLVEQGLMKPEDVKKSRAKNIVLQACGKQPDVIVAQRKLPLRLGDRLLLCSDGLTLHVEDEEIELVLKEVANPDAAAAKLVELVNARGGKDNVTVLVAEVRGAVLPPDDAETVDATLSTIREFAPGEPV